ncbi:hypothetical protein [Flavobacterium sp. PL02]|uniref:hypothetical protein n=1 Tax=Flavobacterium sp. PL02 TaxID=3088354 RepID=UPI002B2304E7|nr:hypothetical protein [Flavobacterium sp. PL02]MEA9411902.1 hypothetical protein [Flavobacterium sp. PL02]
MSKKKINLKLDESLLKKSIEADSDEVGVIGVSLAITAIAASVIFSDNFIFLRIVCVGIYILGGLSTSFLYFTFLSHKIPITINTWLKNGGLGFRGTIWIVLYFFKIFFKQMFYIKGNNISTIRELGYLTILAMLSILWWTFAIAIIVVFIDFKST